SQVELTGSSFFDYVHHQDRAEVAEQLGMPLPQFNTGRHSPSLSDDGSSSSSSAAEKAYLMSNTPPHGYDIVFCARMKSTLTKRGVHVKSAGFR
ncbi:PREDICTED: neuronal PAS domain-containing protein 1-like, partial [Priapulus caudatus]|uniref:Neuronal PAS domain-containing protein 1-like n=1 Tax=Priapulus caudatus TaxID=37621 RepID=A0ABM1F5U3_PRICU